MFHIILCFILAGSALQTEPSGVSFRIPTDGWGPALGLRPGTPEGATLLSCNPSGNLNYYYVFE